MGKGVNAAASMSPFLQKVGGLLAFRKGGGGGRYKK